MRQRQTCIEEQERYIRLLEELARTLLTGHDRVIESRGINDLHPLEVLQGIVQRDRLGDGDILPISTDIVDEIGEAVFLCLPQKAIELEFPALATAPELP